uniref:Replication factor A C-terminal domain-containing protein n=1 Tax=Daucus carota subsp. sativus TaxID=79200 RepID=A0A164YFT6_DAUCS
MSFLGVDLANVVGEIENTNIECNRNKDDDKKSHIRFRITDGRTSLNLTFFNQIGEEFEKALKANISAQVIVVIVSAKANEHEGSPCLNNYPATRFYFNVAHHSIKALKKSLLDRNKVVMMTDECEEAVVPIFTIAEIKKLGNEYKEKQVQCIITVKKIDQKSNWYDNVCTTCGEEVNIVEGRYKCVICSRSIPFPDKRFRLATICSDSTGVLAVILPDDEIQRIIGKNAFDLENEEEYDQSEVKFPKVLKDFEQKEFSLTLKISERNLDKTSNIYHALKVNGPLEKLGYHSPTNVQTNPAQEISAPLITIPSSSLKRSPPTAKSSSKARSKEKREGDGLEIEDNVPIGKYKIVKTEKT